MGESKVASSVPIPEMRHSDDYIPHSCAVQDLFDWNLLY